MSGKENVVPATEKPEEPGKRKEPENSENSYIEPEKPEEAENTENPPPKRDWIFSCCMDEVIKSLPSYPRNVETWANKCSFSCHICYEAENPYYAKRWDVFNYHVVRQHRTDNDDRKRGVFANHLPTVVLPDLLKIYSDPPTTKLVYHACRLCNEYVLQDSFSLEDHLETKHAAKRMNLEQYYNDHVVRGPETKRAKWTFHCCSGDHGCSAQN